MNQDAAIERVLDDSARYFGVDRSHCGKCRPAMRPMRGALHPADAGERWPTLRRSAD
jgi:hypothetical protein